MSPAQMYLAAMALAGLVGLASLLAFAVAARQRRFAPVPLVLAVGAGALVALLAAMQAKEAEVDACAQELRRVGAAVQLYAESGGAEAPESLEVLVPFFFEALPECPTARAAGAANPYPPGYECHQGTFTIVCRGHLHGGPGGAPQDFPRFTSAEGLQYRP